MPRQRNPFTPTAGASPPLLIGRSSVLDEVVESLEDGPGAPARLTLFTGARGVGKTVMLNEVADRALPLGWLVINETATPGLLGRLAGAVSRELRRIDPASAPGRDVTGISLPVLGGGITLSERPAVVLAWRDEVNLLLDALSRHGGGLLITVDEVHAAGREDLRDVGATFQHLVREGREVALMAAGLPAAISDLLNDDVLTFLRRAHRVVLDDVPLDEVGAALRETITTSGRTIDDDALVAATTATGGYPFMVQLVGHQVWRAADGGPVDMAAVAAGVPAARRRLGSTVHASALGDLSAVDRTYLLAMSHDDGESSTGEIASRLGVGPQYANTYRERLVAAGLVEVTRRGHVDLALPYLRDCLREHAASIEMASRQPARRRAQPGQGDRPDR